MTTEHTDATNCGLIDRANEPAAECGVWSPSSTGRQLDNLTRIVDGTGNFVPTRHLESGQARDGAEVISTKIFSTLPRSRLSRRCSRTKGFIWPAIRIHQPIHTHIQLIRLTSKTNA